MTTIRRDKKAGNEMELFMVQLKKLKKKAGYITLEVPFALLLILFVFIMGLSGVHSVVVRTYVNSDMNTFLQSVRINGYATAEQVDGVATLLADSRGYDKDDVIESIYVSRVNAAGEIKGSLNALNGYEHGELAPENRVERGSGDYILIQLNYETDDDWWANTAGRFGSTSNMEYITFNERIGSEYYNPDAEWNGGVPND